MIQVGKLGMRFQVSIVLILSACSAMSNQSGVRSRTPEHVLEEIEIVESIWRLNEKIVLEMTRWFEDLTYTAYSLQDFSVAIEFFEETTGITSYTGSLFGRVPNESVYATLAEWNAWFEENKQTLVLTPSSCLSKAPVAGDTEEAQEMEER